MTDVMLTNRALIQAKQPTIDSLDDNSELASYCKENLPLMVEDGLLQHPWGFARKRAALSKLTVEYSDWLYTYDMPDDMVQPEYYVPEGSNVKLGETEYEIFENSETADRASGRIATNEVALEIVYTKKMLIIPHLPYYFADAVSFLFAYHLATTFGGLERANQNLMVWLQSKLPWAIGKDNDRKRRNVKGETTLTDGEGTIFDPYGYSK